MKSGTQFSLLCRYMTVGSSGRWPMLWQKAAGADAVRRPLHQLSGKAAADALAHVEEFMDAEVVHAPKLIVGKCIPRVKKARVGKVRLSRGTEGLQTLPVEGIGFRTVGPAWMGEASETPLTTSASYHLYDSVKAGCSSLRRPAAGLGRGLCRFAGGHRRAGGEGTRGRAGSYQYRRESDPKNA